MSFFDKAKAAAKDLAAQADAAMQSSGLMPPGAGLGGAGGAGGAGGSGGDRALRDLGVLAWLEATGRPVSAEDKARVMETLRSLESGGQLGSLTVSPPMGAPGAPPPPPGYAAQQAAAAASGSAAPPPPPPPAPAPAPSAPASSAPASSAPAAESPSAGGAPPPPPPPPSWA